MTYKLNKKAWITSGLLLSYLHENGEKWQWLQGWIATLNLVTIKMFNDVLNIDKYNNVDDHVLTLGTVELIVKVLKAYEQKKAKDSDSEEENCTWNTDTCLCCRVITKSWTVFWSNGKYKWCNI